MTSRLPHRRRANPLYTARTGTAGEALAAAGLARAGYRVVARNLRTEHGEIDLLVRRRRTWIAVEV